MCSTKVFQSFPQHLQGLIPLGGLLTPLPSPHHILGYPFIHLTHLFKGRIKPKRLVYFFFQLFNTVRLTFSQLITMKIAMKLMKFFLPPNKIYAIHLINHLLTNQLCY